MARTGRNRCGSHWSDAETLLPRRTPACTVVTCRRPRGPGGTSHRESFPTTRTRLFTSRRHSSSGPTRRPWGFP